MVPIPIPLSATVLTDENVLRILAGKGIENQERRGIYVVREYDNILIMTQATVDGCVRILNGTQPELSSQDSQRVMLIAPRSQMKDVITDAGSKSPPEAVFGPEPEHGWCYYYQKASLARQQGDWNKVAKLGDEALSQGYYPGDSIEWFPFLQAYVALDNQEKLHPLVSIINADPFLKQQACRILTATAHDGAMQNFVQQTFCE
ncbi:MAG: hypothetical protein HY258_11335 [Chloroflexi bacterium]|nr:hypothetical protein [Chloroflexota bacterium]